MTRMLPRVPAAAALALAGAGGCGETGSQKVVPPVIGPDDGAEACGDGARPPAAEWPACGPMGDGEGEQGAMADVTDAVGIDFRNHGSPEPGGGIGAGVCVLDHDNDGDLDVFLIAAQEVRSRLYRNDCGRFTDVTTEVGLMSDRQGLGCLAYDYDGDGDPDLFRSNFGPNQLYRNECGVFRDVTEEVGLVSSPIPHTSATAGDVDGDGDLDVAVGGRPNVLYIYDAAADTFTDEAAARGLHDIDAKGGVNYEEPLATLLADFDGDGDLDLFVGNDGSVRHPDRLFRNDGTGQFSDAAPELGLDDSNDSGNSADTMGVDVGDCDGDGVLEVLITNQATQGTAFLFDCRRDDGHLRCPETAARAGLASTGKWVQWGVALADFDHDRDLDAFVASGGLYDFMDQEVDQPSQLFWNNGDCTFEEAESTGGLAVRRNSRGAAFGDLDNDGDVDAVIANLGNTRDGHPEQPPQILRNDAAAGHWLQVLPIGCGANRDAVGAVATVATPGFELAEPRLAGGSYLGSSDPRVHFGLGEHERATVRVRWPGGGETDLGEVAADRLIVVRCEGGAGAAGVTR